MTATPDRTAANQASAADKNRAERARLWERVPEILADWRARWPAVFTTPVPLTVGIARRIKDQLGAERPPRREISAAIHQWTNRTSYLRAIARGDARRNLDGSEAGVPDEETRERARQVLADRDRRAMERARRKRARLAPAE